MAMEKRYNISNEISVKMIILFFLLKNIEKNPRIISALPLPLVRIAFATFDLNKLLKVILSKKCNPEQINFC
jgi:hypothetical protein